LVQGSCRITDLVKDIFSILENGSEVTDAEATEFGSELATIIQDRLVENLNGPRPFTLRMSNIGKGARQLWYAKHFEPEEKLSGKTLLKFLLGDIAESVLLFLAKLSGHSVTNRQAEVVVEGIKGHIDADIDGVTVDVKTASPYGFKKFESGTLAEDDAFGYIEQIAGYSKARETAGAFLAIEKVSGDLAYLEYTQEELAVFKIVERIQYLKEAVEQEEPPERCYPDEPMGASGNRKLGTNCSYCDFKKRCWADSNGGIGLRTFIYSTGPVFLTEVKSEPKVYEKSF